MRLFILAILTFEVFASNDDLWHEWKRMYNKEYNRVDDAHRRNIWEENVKHIQEHNIRHDLGLVKYTLGFNQFTDMTFEEFKATYLREIPRASDMLSHGIPYEANDRAVPESIDWREFGYVTNVKDQDGPCKYDSRLGVAKVTGYYTVDSGDELELKNLVGVKGPVAVAVDVEFDFMMYSLGCRLWNTEWY
ncbi:Cysteine protease [Fasciola hepatica]|uniref:Cysteine protease n=1 Tax=Fasciola hepatica TaxID=6192 RepID=A0A4E0RQP0_FASHE|nr:Cysteine protease [Fasciola hepatica]